jgi:beta-lactamase superfamily II metal-dependent hydrolase
MAAAPSSVTIRMYNVGFGDCFLLSFQYAKSKRHMLVDYGSTSAPKRGRADYMQRIADDIKTVCAGKLHVLVATHRHQDHISGFSTTTKTGATIAALKPDHVIQPWTEDPRAKINALTPTASIYTAGKPNQQKLAAHFLGALFDMHGVAQSIASLAARRDLAGTQTLNQLKFIGEDNIQNRSAVRNLIQMGKRGKAYYANAGMKLNVLPGVRCTVLGPPTLKQSDAIRKQRARDADNFWQFRTFWGSQHLAMRQYLTSVGSGKKRRSTPSLPPGVRWFITQSRQIQASQVLGLVRNLDNVMNNTSLILLLEAGKRKILLPGDAQIENWSYALSHPEWTKRLKEVNVYKVGHHGSLNATPKPLWASFKNKGGRSKANRLDTLCSTKAGKHGSVTSGTEVPRRTLVDELKKDSAFLSSEESRESFCNQVTLAF